MGFIKHLGRHGDRKVAIMYRKVPNEEHMALVIYPETLPAVWHDTVMKVIEGAPAQDADQLADAMDRAFLPDGKQMLQTLHKEGKLKKVQTNQIIVTPNATSTVKLDELNKIIDGMADGGDAAKKMADLDANIGMDHNKNQHLKIDEAADIVPMAGRALDNVSLGTDMLTQSTQMAAEGAALVAESNRLQKEAFKLNPALKPKRVVKKKVAKKKATTK